MTSWFDEPPPPLRRHKFEFAPPMPEDPPIYADIIREAIRNMSDQERTDIAKSILSIPGQERPTKFDVIRLAAQLKAWARKPS